MTRKPFVIASLLFAGWCSSFPATAGDIAGAGSGSTGGVINGTTNESSNMTRTGVDSAGQPSKGATGKVPSKQLPDNAVLNAPREPTPDAAGKSGASNLNGQTP